MSTESIDRLRRWHLVLLRKTQEGTTPEVLTEVRNFINYCRNTGMFVSDLKDREYLRSLLLRWGEFVIQHSEDAEYIDLSLLPFEKEMAIGEEREAVVQAKEKPRQQHVIKIALAILNVLVFTVIILIFQNQIAAIGDHVEKWLGEGVATPSAVATIPGVDSIEVWMDGGRLDLDQLPSLASGQAVELEIVVIDTRGKRYRSDELVCTWSVAPLGDEDDGINTEICRTFYIPSQEYSNQTVVLEVKGLEQQFEPSDPISMKFDIVK